MAAAVVAAAGAAVVVAVIVAATAAAAAVMKERKQQPIARLWKDDETLATDSNYATLTLSNHRYNLRPTPPPSPLAQASKFENL